MAGPSGPTWCTRGRLSHEGRTCREHGDAGGNQTTRLACLHAFPCRAHQEPPTLGASPCHVSSVTLQGMPSASPLSCPCPSTRNASSLSGCPWPSPPSAAAPSPPPPPHRP